VARNVQLNHQTHRSPPAETALKVSWYPFPGGGRNDRSRLRLEEASLHRPEELLFSGAFQANCAIPIEYRAVQGQPCFHIAR
jgi:hypothetical protein